MKKYKYIFVVLVYKNTDVLKSFFESLKHINNYRVVLVNAYYDQISYDKCQQFALSHNADFVEIPNKGYGGGNNDGVKFVIEHYCFNFLIISNSDIIVKDINCLDEFVNDSCVLASNTIQLNGRHQNPSAAVESKLYLKLMRKGFEENNYYLVRLSHIFSRFYRELFLFASSIIKRKKWRIFAAHGSFMVFTAPALEKLSPIFNDKMFLYNEEIFLAYKCKAKDVPVYYVPNLRVLHLEGASAGNDFKKLFNLYRESFLAFDEVYKRNDF